MNTSLIGKKLDNYKIIAPLGSGAMATVYHADDMMLDRPVALKVIRAELDSEVAEQFLREARSVARWQHPNIVQVYAANSSDDYLYIAMELIEGTDLATLLKKEEGLLPVARVLEIGRSVATALDHAHEQGAIHRDVKPANILIADDGRIALSDFGLVMLENQKTLFEAIGTPHYVAPEQARKSADAVPQSDIYALGVVLYELLTGRVPFDDPSLVSVLVQHATQPPPDPQEINPALNRPTADVLLKAMAKQPTERYQTATEFINTLAAAIENAVPIADSTVVRSDSTADEAAPSVDPTVVRNEPAAFVVPPTVVQAAESPQSGTPPTVVKPPADEGTRLKPKSSIPSARPVATPPPTAQETRRQLSPYTILGLGAILLLCLMLGYFVWGGGDDATVIDPETGAVVVVDDLDGEAVDGAEGAAVDETLDLASTATVAGEAGVVLQPPTAESGVAPVSGRVLRLSWDANNFYAYNPTGESIAIRPIEFTAVGDDRRLKGSAWAGYFRDIQPGKCDAVEIIGQPNNRPGDCQGFNAIRTPKVDQKEAFFVPRDGVSEFVVTYDGIEIGRCAIAAGGCEVTLP